MHSSIQYTINPFLLNHLKPEDGPPNSILPEPALLLLNHACLYLKLYLDHAVKYKSPFFARLVMSQLLIRQKSIFIFNPQQPNVMKC